MRACKLQMVLVFLMACFALCRSTPPLHSQRGWDRNQHEDLARDDRNEYDADPRDLYRLGEFNDRCRSRKDCRQFGYVCRDNRTCQCDFMYVPDAKRHACVGGVNQRCIYDEHCIEGAFCMNQALCKCKNSSPIELEDGLVCAGADQLKTIDLAVTIAFLTILDQLFNVP